MVEILRYQPCRLSTSATFTFAIRATVAVTGATVYAIGATAVAIGATAIGATSVNSKKVSMYIFLYC